MKGHIIEYILERYISIWPEDYYLADFILSWIISHPGYYYNYNRPMFFSLTGKGGKLYYIFDVIDFVSNTKESKFRFQFKDVVNALLDVGAPRVLFSEKYCI